MTQRKRLSTRQLEKDDAPGSIERLNREHIPFLRQLAPGTVITGSRSVDTVAILTKLLAVLDATGVVDDSTIA